MADKRGRVQTVIQKDLSEIIIYDIKDEITKFASVNQVKMTSDYSYCTVYVSHIDADKTDALVAFLNKREPKIRSLLAHKLDIYKTPELRFVADKLFEQGQRMANIIDKAVNSKPKTLADIYPEMKKKEESNMKKPSNRVKKTAKPTEKKVAAKPATKKTAAKPAAEKKPATKKTK